MKELSTRERRKLNSRFVMGVCPGPSEEEFSSAVSRLDVIVRGNKLRDYQYGIVLHKGDRNLHDVCMYERPDLAHSKVYLKEIATAVGHLHERGIVHQDLKPLNILRYDNRMVLTDMDAASSVEDGDCAGAKFSSGVLPPEMFVRLKTESELTEYENHFAHVDRSLALWEKIKPMETENGKIVVRTFNDSDTHGDRKLPLPYQLVKAHPTQDVWALGCLMYTVLIGQALVPINMDDDVAGPEAMLQAATWTDERIRDRIYKRQTALKDEKALDLLVQLLRVDPNDRFQSMADVLFHPFFFDKDHHGYTDDTVFVQEARELKLTPIDKVPVIVTNLWKFNKLSDRLHQPASIPGSVPWGAEEETMARESCSLTAKALHHNINVALNLPHAAQVKLAAQVTDETDKYLNVQNSMFENLVKKEEPENFNEFEKTFASFDVAMQAAQRDKSPQSTGDIVALYNRAARIKPRVDKVIVF